MAMPGYGVYDTDAQEIESRRRYAEALRQQGMQPLETQMAGRVAIPISWAQGAAKLLQGYAGSKGVERAGEERRALGERYKSDLSETLAKALKAGSGEPARPQQMSADDMAMIADQGGESNPMIPAVRPDRAAMAQILMGHPATQQMGMQQMMSDSQRQGLMSSMGIGGSGQVQGQPQSIPAQSGGMGSSLPTPQPGGPAGGLPMAAWLQADPSGKSYMAQLAKDRLESAKFGLDERKLAQDQAQWEGLSAYQKAQLANQGISSAIDLAKARDQGLNVQGVPAIQQGMPQAMPQQPAMPAQPQQPTMAPDMQISPQLQAQRDAEAAAIRGREATGTGIPTAAVVPGSNAGLSPAQQREINMADVKRGREKASEVPQATLSVQTQLGDISRLRNLADEILKSPALDRSVGITGALPSVPGSEASNVDALIEAMAAQISGYKLQAMRSASKTGGAVGQVTEKEWPRLENMIIALKTKMSPDKYREKLGELILEMDKAEQSIAEAFQKEYGTTVGRSQPKREPKPPIYAVNPTTKQRIMSVDGGMSWEPAR